MTTRRLFAVLLFVAIFALAIRETLDPDLWWHLRTGQAILSDGIPRQDIFSFTASTNPWTTHEWLSEVILWLGYSLVRLPGLMVIFGGLITASYWLVYRRCTGRPYLAGFIILLAAAASTPFWGVRPQIFNLLGTAAFIFLVEGFKDDQNGRRALWLLPLLTLIWANLHSGYLLGIVLLVTYVVGESLSRLSPGHDRRTLTWPDIGYLAGLTGLSFLAAALNPNGPALWIYPFFTLGSNAMQRYIQEWHSPDFHLAIFWPFALMLFWGFAAFIFSRRRPTVTDLLLFGGTAAAGLLSSRNIPIFALVAAPIVTRYGLSALDGSRLYPILSGLKQAPPARQFTALNWVILGISIVAALLWAGEKIQANEPAIAAYFPVAAVDYLEQSGLDQARVYNSYNWGGYLIWRGLPVFVDGRADVYGDEFLHYYRQTFDLSDNWQRPLDEYAVDYILMEKNSPLNRLLAESDGWRLDYADDVAVIYARTDG